MKDIRMKSERFEFDGKLYQLRCNMSVLAEVQETAGGNVMDLLRDKATLKTSLVFLAAMLNDFADEKGWPKRYTPAEVGRLLPASNIGKVPVMVMGIVTDALSSDEEDDPGNPGARQTESAEESTLPGT